MPVFRVEKNKGLCREYRQLFVSLFLPAAPGRQGPFDDRPETKNPTLRVGFG